jgi:outer membrane protein assembly factor BamB
MAPAVAPDGTIYTASRAHFDHRVTYLVAVNPDLSLKWAASLQNLLSDGCGVIVPIGPTNSTPNACRVGTTPGVDPTTNAKGSALIDDQGSSSPTLLPDGSILVPALTSYNGARGHLFKFDASGNFLGAFDFGWDSTPAVYAHDNTYSIVIKDNHYPTALYCPYRNSLCPPVAEAYYITQLSASLQVEWKFQSTNTQSCFRNPDGSLNCVSDHPNGFEWCINAPAIDMNGTVYANSEDGNLYTLPQGNTGVFTKPKQSIFLNLAIGAAYTPLSLGADGKIYTENDGHMFVVGN